MIAPSTPAGLFNLGRADTDAACTVAGARHAADTGTQGDAAVSFASLLLALLGGAPEVHVEAAATAAQGTDGAEDTGRTQTTDAEGGDGASAATDGIAGGSSLRGDASPAPLGSRADALGRVGRDVQTDTANDGTSVEAIGSGDDAAAPRGPTQVELHEAARPARTPKIAAVREDTRGDASVDAIAGDASTAPEATATKRTSRRDTAAGAGQAPDPRGEQAPSAPPPAASASAAAAADVRTVDRAMSHLDPEMREKVQRVIERMASEHGSDVVLQEGQRTPERQAWLYEQGRSRPGPVVTWTKSSMHSKGLAADLKVEDAGVGTRPYEVLQQVAKEEGLSVLGMKDPGHVELRAEGSDGTDSDAGETKPQTPTSRIAAARAATPAAPAHAGAARAARVADVARPAHVAARVAPTAHAATSARAATSAYAQAASGSHARPAQRTDDKAVEPARQDGTISAQQPRSAPQQGGTRQVAGPTGPAPALPMERIEKMVEAMEARDAALGPGARRVSVRLDGTAGPVERVQVQMLDKALRSQVTVGDARLAARLKDSTTELLRTLERGGYDARSIDVKNTARVPGTQEVLAAAARGENVTEAVRTLFASDHGTGRDAPDGRTGRDDGGDPRRQDGTAHHSRRDNRRKDR